MKQQTFKLIEVTCVAMFLIMFALKLSGHIDFSWWIITSPLWGQIALALSACAISCICFGIAKSIIWIRFRIRKRKLR